MLRKRIKKEGIDITGKDSLIALCCDNFKLQANDVIELFRNANAPDYAIDILLTKKNIRTRLNPEEPSPTIVTLPDDYINPWEDRIISVREMARCQSFDDSFVFLGKRTGNYKSVTYIKVFVFFGRISVDIVTLYVGFAVYVSREKLM